MNAVESEGREVLDFRAIIGAAPLKPERAGRGIVGSINFRAIIGAAPLKPHVKRLSRERRHRFPRHHWRGGAFSAPRRARAASFFLLRDRAERS